MAEPHPVDTADLRPRLEKAFDTAEHKVRETIGKYPDYFPIYTQNGKWKHGGELWTDWCAGFHAGMMWLIHLRTRRSLVARAGRTLLPLARTQEARPRRPRPRLHLPQHLPALVPGSRTTLRSTTS